MEEDGIVLINNAVGAIQMHLSMKNDKTQRCEKGHCLLHLFSGVVDIGRHLTSYTITRWLRINSLQLHWLYYMLL